MLRYWLCKLGLHDWKVYTKGHMHEGFVYPLRFRACNLCTKQQQEILDKVSETTKWQDVKHQP